MLDEAQGENRQHNSGGMSEGNRDQGADNRGPPFFLQAKRQRKQPAHGWIQTVVCPENARATHGQV